MAQYLRPDSTVAQGSWTGTYANVDEVTPADGDYTESNKVASTHQMTLSAPAATPGSGTCTVRWRGRRRLTNKSAEVTIEIWNGTSAMVADATETKTDPAGTFTTWDTLTFSTADVSSWSDLQVRLVASPTPGVDFDVSWIEVEVPDGAATYTRTTGLAAALQRQNILRTASADAGLRATFTRTTDLAAVLAGHAHLSVDLAAALQQLQTATAQSDAAVRAAISVSADLDAMISLGVISSTATTELDAVFAALVSAQASIDAALAGVMSQSTELGAVLRATGIAQSDIDAALAALFSRTADLDAALASAGRLTTDTDAAVLQSLIRTADLDARLVIAGIAAVYADVDAAVQRVQLAQTVIDAGLALVTLRTADLDARISVAATTQTAQTDFDAALRALMFVTATTDAALLRQGVTGTADLDARLYDPSAATYPTPGRTIRPGIRNRSRGVLAVQRQLYVDNCAQRIDRPTVPPAFREYDSAFGKGFR